MKTIIFVCHGSICRSPAAAFIALKYLKEHNRDGEFNIRIRATSSEEIGNDVYPPMKRELFSTMRQMGMIGSFTYYRLVCTAFIKYLILPNWFRRVFHLYDIQA